MEAADGTPPKFFIVIYLSSSSLWFISQFAAMVLF